LIGKDGDGWRRRLEHRCGPTIFAISGRSCDGAGDEGRLGC
jgi:hypothetical protein